MVWKLSRPGLNQTVDGHSPYSVVRLALMRASTIQFTYYWTLSSTIIPLLIRLYVLNYSIPRVISYKRRNIHVVTANVINNIIVIMINSLVLVMIFSINSKSNISLNYLMEKAMETIFNENESATGIKVHKIIETISLISLTISIVTDNVFLYLEI